MPLSDRRSRTLLVSLLLMTGLPGSSAADATRMALRCWPERSVVKYNTPVYIHVALENETYRPIWVTVGLFPDPAQGNRYTH